MAVPNFKPYGASGNLAQEGDYYKENPWQDRWGGQANKFLNSQPMMTSQQLLNAGQGYVNQLGKMGEGWQQFGPNDPRIGQWYGQQQDKAKMAANSAAGQFANAGVAAGRGGYGVAGGSPQASSYARSAMDSVVGSQDQRYGNAVNYTKQGVDTANDQLRLMLPMYAQLYGQGLGAAGNLASSVYNTQIGAGTNLAGLSENSYRDYFNAASGANQRDVGNYNNAMMGDYSRTQGILNDQQARTDKAAQNNRQLEIDNMMRLVSGSQNMSGGQFGAGGTRQGLLTYLQSMGLMQGNPLGAGTAKNTATPQEVLYGRAGQGR